MNWSLFSDLWKSEHFMLSNLSVSSWVHHSSWIPFVLQSCNHSEELESIPAMYRIILGCFNLSVFIPVFFHSHDLWIFSWSRTFHLQTIAIHSAFHLIQEYIWWSIFFWNLYLSTMNPTWCHNFCLPDQICLGLWKASNCHSLTSCPLKKFTSYLWSFQPC